jgi:Putative MetA-pathway of phenol degradation
MDKCRWHCDNLTAAAAADAEPQSFKNAIGSSSFPGWAILASLSLLSSCATEVHGQDLVPGAYAPAPVGFNVLTIATVFNDGAVAFDPSLPVEDAQATIGVAAVGVSRTLDIAGRFASIGMAVPVVVGHVEGQVFEQFQEASRSGFGDLSARIALNLYGTPAMTSRQYAAYRPTTVVGVSLSVGAPIGQYNSAQYINLGTNRWSFKPEIGIARTQSRWTFEGDIGAVLLTDNSKYVNESTRQQSPIVSFQGHLIYTMRPGAWVAADGNYWKGGRVTIDGIEATQQQENSRVGATLALPIRRQQLRVSYSFGAYTTIGGDYHSIGMSYSFAWAARQ